MNASRRFSAAVIRLATLPPGVLHVIQRMYLQGKRDLPDLPYTQTLTCWSSQIAGWTGIELTDAEMYWLLLLFSLLPRNHEFYIPKEF